MSKEIKHTQGEWVNLREEIRSKQGMLIATIKLNADMDEAYTNAQFIVTACNSYYQNQERIKRLEELLKEVNDSIDFKYNNRSALGKKIEQALKEGE